MKLTTAFREQAQSCAKLGSPFMERLLTLLADHWPKDSALARHLSSFTGDIGPSGASLPLRLAGGLHALKLSNQSPDLVAVYPPNLKSDDNILQIVLHVLHEHEDFLISWTNNAPQTNEVRRSAALIAGAHVAAQRFDLPIHLSELGASGGLNLMWDHYALNAGGTIIGHPAPALTLQPDWAGPPPPKGNPVIATRAGVDLNPLNASDPSDLLRLMAYLWPDQPDRLALTQAAAKITTTRIDRGDAVEWLESRLSDAPGGHLHLIQHTVAWQYFPQAAQAFGQSMIEAAGAVATADRPLGWLSLENDGDNTGATGAALTLRLWPGNEVLTLGRADFHGRWVQWAGLT
ncbi:MAG: DUF2332 family protein [Sulfitobacter sp.]